MPTIYTHPEDDSEEVMTSYKSLKELEMYGLLIETNTYKEWFKEHKVYRDDYDSSLSLEQSALCEEKLIWFMPQYGGWCVTPENREKIFNYKAE